MSTKLQELVDVLIELKLIIIPPEIKSRAYVNAVNRILELSNRVKYLENVIDTMKKGDT